MDGRGRDRTSWQNVAMSTTWSVQIGAEVRRRRERAGLKFNSLSERTRELGWPVHRVALPKIESGERDISIRELVGIAAALDVSPLTLVFPNVLDDVEVLPGVIIAGIDVFAWWTGVGGVTDKSARDRFTKDEGIRIASALVDVEKALRLNRIALKQAELSYDLHGHDSERDRADQVRDRIERIGAERERLVDAYRNATEERSTDA